MNKLIKLLPMGALIAFAWLSLQGCYTAKQLYYQGNLLSTRKPISVILWDKNTPPELRDKLKEVETIREYARKVGLSVGGAYGTYIESPNDAVSYVVQASNPLKLKLKTWWFPIIGDVPYLGFFHQENRDEMAIKLKEKGYDVAETEAGAFSSLGWYDDPVYSSMLERPHYSLAHLFFHEITHRTFWIPDEATLNEHMAEFIAGLVTVDYLTSRGMSKQLNAYKQSRADRRLYKAWLKEMRKSLKTLYARDISDIEKLSEKERIFKRFLGAKFPNFSSKSYQYLKSMEWNNAVVLGASLYTPDTKPFEKAYRCGKYTNVGSFLKALEKAFEDQDQQPATKVLESLCPMSTLGWLGGE